MAPSSRTALLFAALALAIALPEPIHSFCTAPINALTLESPIPVSSDNRFLTPRYDGTITLRTNEQLRLYCSSTFRNYQTVDTLSVTCQSNGQFRITGVPKDIGLTSTDLYCTGKNGNYELRPIDNEMVIGYSIGSGAAHNFEPIISMSFNEALKRTQYTYHVLQPVAASQRVNNRPSWRTDRFFSGPDSNYYHPKTQRDTVCGTLRLNQKACDQLFVPNIQYLVRGHLAPAADFFYLSSKWVTYSMVNAAPQWQQLNNGPWVKMESDLRTRSANSGRPLDIYTGTLRTLRLPDANGIYTDIYLNPASKKIPVPEVFFKVVLDTSVSGQEKGVVFLALNNPYASALDVQNVKQQIGCSDQADVMSWPSIWFDGSNKRLNRDQAAVRAKGYMWACKVEDFNRNLLALPNGDNNYPLALFLNYKLMKH